MNPLQMQKQKESRQVRVLVAWHVFLVSPEFNLLQPPEEKKTYKY